MLLINKKPEKIWLFTYTKKFVFVYYSDICHSLEYRIVIHLNTIKITTVSSGRIESNTSKIKIYDSSRFYELTSNIDKGESAEINIIIKQ